MMIVCCFKLIIDFVIVVDMVNKEEVDLWFVFVGNVRIVDFFDCFLCYVFYLICMCFIIFVSYFCFWF